MMSIEIEGKRLRPGGVVRGRLVITGDDGRVELSVLWETSGKGDTDLGVVLFRTVEGAGTHSFEAPLPLLPLTYEGGLVRIDWLVRARRLRTMSGDDIVQESFRVDAVPA